MKSLTRRDEHGRVRLEDSIEALVVIEVENGRVAAHTIQRLVRNANFVDPVHARYVGKLGSDGALGPKHVIHAPFIHDQDDGHGRKAALVRITRLVRKTLSGGQARLIGSSALGLALPTSDVDLTVLGRSEAGRRADLDALQAAVQSSGLGRRCLVIHAKKVSILKFVEAQSGLSTDLSVAVPGGLTTLAWMRGQVTERPSLHPLLLVLKL